VTTTIAVPELRRYAPDALRMVGIPQGQSDETADMLVWTEAVVGGAIHFVQRNRARLLWVPRPRMRVVAESPEEIVIDARGGSLLEFGVRIGDFTCAEALAAGARRVVVRNVYGLVFLPYLTTRAAERGVEVTASWVGEHTPTAESGDEPRTVITLESRVGGEPSATGLDTPSWRDAVERGIELDDDDFATIAQLFELLRVPTSERSRTHAG
jgi:hypothetical protein